jgi:hypothetical protein
MANLTAAEITNLYLYGTKSTPSNLVDDKLIRPATLPVPTAVEVDKNDFMKSVGRFAVGAQFELVKKFFDPGFFDPTIPTGTYTKQQLAAKFGISNFGWDMGHTDYQDNVDDYAERVYIWNSQSFQISDNAVFIVEPDGKRRIENFSIEPRKDVQENFDFVGGGIIAAIGNPYLQERVDPSKIGRTVNINFTGSLTGIKYDKTSFENDQAKISSWGGRNLFKLKPDIDKLLDNLFTGGVTKFLYGNKPILYGTVENNTLSADKVSDYPTLKAYKDNGVVLIGGQGADNLTGGSKDDVFIGGEGDDTIDGGSFLFGLFPEKDKDESRYKGARSDYDIEFLSDKSVKITDKLSGRDGSDTLKNIETAVFSDKSVNLKRGQDIAFVIDTTGSMWDDIDAVKVSASNIINSIFDNFLDSRIAVVGYNDPTTNTFLSFTDQPKIEDRNTAAL